ncbi:MAG: hypothetical protein ABFE07_17140 [Armatimonadia bacterium]
MVKPVLCGSCGREFGSGAALAAHNRARHKDAGAVEMGPNRRALEETLKELRDMGHLGPMEAALVQLARSLAGAVDRDCGHASLCRTYHDVLEALMGDHENNDTFADLIAEINSRAPLGHTPET